jgi:ABC-type uncharacterized transport system permease subunit
MTCAFIGIILHTITLSNTLILNTGLDLGFSNIASLTTWMIAVLLVLASISKPVENLGILIFPCASVAQLIAVLSPSEQILVDDVSRELQIHILISILAYSILSIAAVQALLVAIQDRHLRHRHPGGIIRALPPLQTMESLLFEAIAAGFVLHSLALLTGVLFLTDIFAQHMVHKTVLSIIAWIVFAILLWGRYYHGWRGKTAIRWTLAGFVILFLGYFGSKFVLEVLI